VGFYRQAFLVFLVKDCKKGRGKQPGKLTAKFVVVVVVVFCCFFVVFKLMAKSFSQPVNLPGAWPLMNPLPGVQSFLPSGLHLAFQSFLISGLHLGFQSLPLSPLNQASSPFPPLPPSLAKVPISSLLASHPHPLPIHLVYPLTQAS